MKEFKRHKIEDSITYFEKWEDVKKLSLAEVTHKDEHRDKYLDGLVIRGYEMKFGNGTNGNGERYLPDCANEFIESYFVANNLNMPIDVEHDARPEWLVGTCIYFETNSVGLYPIAYIPREHPQFSYVKMLLENGMIQGFSKCGWCTQGKWVEDEKEKYGGYWLVEKVEIVRMSLVSTPANGIGFESVKETNNAITFVDNTENKKSGFAAMFNNKNKEE